MKRLILSVCTILLVGCGVRIPHSIDPAYTREAPRALAVKVVGGSDTQKEMVGEIVLQRLKQKGYNPSLLSEDKGSETRGKALMVVEIEEWKKKGFWFYVTYEVSMRFILYGEDGRVLWSSHNGVNHTTVDLEGDRVKLARYRPFEPYVERVVDVSLSTLPDYPG